MLTPYPITVSGHNQEVSTDTILLTNVLTLSKFYQSSHWCPCSGPNPIVLFPQSHSTCGSSQSGSFVTCHLWRALANCCLECSSIYVCLFPHDEIELAHLGQEHQSSELMPFSAHRFKCPGVNMTYYSTVGIDSLNSSNGLHNLIFTKNHIPNPWRVFKLKGPKAPSETQEWYYHQLDHHQRTFTKVKKRTLTVFILSLRCYLGECAMNLSLARWVLSPMPGMIWGSGVVGSRL